MLGSRWAYSRSDLLLARTRYSLLTAPTAPRALCEEAVRRGCDHLVLTDRNALYGLYPFAREAARAGSNR